MTTTHTTRAYLLRIGSDHDLIARIANAYRTAGIKPPTRADEVRQLLEDEPAPEAVAAALAAESLAVEDLDSWTAQAIDRIQRAQAVHTLRQALAAHREGATKANRPGLIRQATTALEKPFRSAVRDLSKVAADLPQPDAFDLDAVIATDATAARRTALEALTKLGAYASVHAVKRSDLPVAARDCLVVVDVPEVPVAQVNRLNRQVVNPHPVRDQVRAFIDSADRDGADQALVDIARGRYPALSFSLAADGVELHERVDRATAAAAGRVVDATASPEPRETKPVVVV